jgi:hypothetical protein
MSVLKSPMISERNPIMNLLSNSMAVTYGILGRLALIAAFVFSLDGELRIAVAAIAVALWMMWSKQNLFFSIAGEMIELTAKKIEHDDEAIT